MANHNIKLVECEIRALQARLICSSSPYERKELKEEIKEKQRLLDRLIMGVVIIEEE